MKRLKNIFASILLLAIAWIFPLWSGTTGKIAGTIKDKTTGEPLPEAIIILDGTSLRTSSDTNGHYTILSIQPGIYNLQVSYIGYRKVTITNIHVDIDQTAWVNIGLESQTAETGDSVVIAEERIIRPGVANSNVTISEKDIQRLPVNDVASAIGLQAGIRGGRYPNPGSSISSDYDLTYTIGKIGVQGDLNIRGGEGDNILFMIDGVIMRDPRNNVPVTSLPLSAIKEVSVERSGFNAEYGQAQSGIINIITREGDKQKYSGSLQIRSSPYAPKYWKGPGTLDVQDPYSFALRPFFDPAVCWTGTENGAWNEYVKRQYAPFQGWNAVSQMLMNDSDPANDLTPAGAQRVFMYMTRKRPANNQPDFDIDGGFGGPVPYVSKALGDLRFFTSYRSNREMLLWPLTRPDYRDYDWTLQLNSDITSSIKLQLLSVVGKQYTLKDNSDAIGIYSYPRSPNEIASVTSDLFSLFSDYNSCLADIGHRSLSAKLTHIINPHTFYEVSFEHFRREYNVHPTQLRDTSQKVEVVPGYYMTTFPYGYFSASTDELDFLMLGTMHASRPRDNSVMNSTTIKANITSQVDFYNLIKVGAEYVSNDLNFEYGSKTFDNWNYHTFKHMHPASGALYVQDKMEIDEFTVNAGLRLDYSNSNIKWWNIIPLDYNTIPYPTESTNTEWQLSPRFGVSWAFRENSKLYFNYGYFRQMSQFPAKTISYELGFDQSFLDDFLLQISAFYKDISSQNNFFDITIDYNSYVATIDNYNNIRGIELTLRKTAGRWLSGFFNYTYQENTGGYSGSAQLFNNIVRQNNLPTNLYQDRPIPQPYARASINLHTPEDFGSSLLGRNVIGGWGLNVVLDWQAGYWTTWNPFNIPSIAYNVEALDFFNVALRLEKIVDLGKFKIQLFIDMDNVFNTLRLSNTNDADYMASLHLPKSDAYANIPGNDMIGEYRKPGVEFQPEEFQRQIDRTQAGRTYVIYFEDNSKQYWQYTNGQWSQVDQKRIDQINKDKAYIDMPNASTFWFLNPRKIYFGLRISFNFDEL
jgi:hypothetical protein